MMNYISIIFILTSIYSIVNYNRVNLPVAFRIYKNKLQVYSDICFYFIEFFYFIWLVINLFLNFKICLPILIITIFSIILFKKKNFKNNLYYQIPKIIGLVFVFLEIEFF